MVLETYFACKVIHLVMVFRNALHMEDLNVQTTPQSVIPNIHVYMSLVCR